MRAPEGDGVGGNPLGISTLNKARYDLKDNFYYRSYIALATLAALSEPVLVSFDSPKMDIAQVSVLGTSSFLFCLGLLLTFTKIKEQGCMKKTFGVWDGQVVFEFIFLVVGWVCIFLCPSLAAIRCFRVFRVFWFFDIYRDGSTTRKGWLMGQVQAGARYLDLLLTEIFTDKSRGGVLVLAMFFFSTYILSICFWHKAEETFPEGNSCESMVKCFLTLMRLSFYDKVGFDFLYFIFSSEEVGLGVLLIVYLCFTSIVLLNGLIGIFGGLFLLPQDQESDVGGGGDEFEEPEVVNIVQKSAEETKSEPSQFDTDAINKSHQELRTLLKTMDEKITKLQSEVSTISSSTKKKGKFSK